MTSRDFRIVGHGSDLAVEMGGPDLAACLDAGIAGFAAALAEVADDMPRRRLTVPLEASDPAELVVALFEELITLLDADGLLPVALTRLREGDDGWEAELEAVPLGEVEIHGVAPKAATWHLTTLAETAGGWRGRVTLDL